MWGQSLGLTPATPAGTQTAQGATAQPGTDGVLGEGNNGVRGVSAAGWTLPPKGDFLPPPTPPAGAGVWGTNTADGPGVYGTSKSSDGVSGFGVNGVSGQSSGPNGSGILGTGGGGGSGAGVTGLNLAGTGVLGTDVSGTGVSGTSTTGTGIIGTSTTGIGVQGICKDPKGLAAKFTGKVHTDGDHEIVGDISVNNVNVLKDVTLAGGDCAEQFDTHGATSPEPGTIMVIDDGGKLRMSHGAYDKRVAGVVSGAGEYRPAIVLDRRASSEGRVSVALVGKVYCKVDADPASVTVGDLLTTSERPGFAMKATDPAQAFGAVICKALKPLGTGQDMIPILVALQ